MKKRLGRKKSRCIMSIIARRNWALRLSIVLNLCVLLYICAHLTSSGTWIEDSSPNWVASNAVSLSETYGSTGNNAQSNEVQKTRVSVSTGAVKPEAAEQTSRQPDGETSVAGAKQKQPQNGEIDSSNGSGGTNSQVAGKTGANEQLNAGNENTVKSTRTEETGRTSKTGENKNAAPRISTLEEAIRCHEKSMEPRRAQRGDYWVWYNYVPMNRTVKCWESVTYTTHADYTFMDNLEPLLERWRAPISIAMYAPGKDFQPTVDSIKYVRSCGSSLIAQFVTFHVYFNSKHMPEKVLESSEVVSASYNCTLGPPWKRFTNTTKMYKNVKNLLYPVNVGRNIARESAPTHYVLASDIELYPNPNLTTAFLDMIARQDHPALRKPNPKVFVLPIFEISAKSKPPLNKTSLMQMLKAGTAISFHKRVCAYCHNVPKSTEWRKGPETESLNIFHVGKRTGSFAHWEPIYIGTNSDPPYDERLSWEGMSDKMTQGYALCVLDYDFLILNNAFLVHRPGIKTFKKDARRTSLTAKTNALISRIIMPELKVLYGRRKGCSV